MKLELLFLAFLSLLLACRFVTQVMLLMSIYRLLRLIRPVHRREISPYEVWFCLLPCIDIGVALRIVDFLTPAIRRQFEAFGENELEKSFGLKIGRCWAYSHLGILFLITIPAILADHSTNIAYIGLMTASLIWILFYAISAIRYCKEINSYYRILRVKIVPDYVQAESDFNDDLRG